MADEEKEEQGAEGEAEELSLLDSIVKNGGIV